MRGSIALSFRRPEPAGHKTDPPPSGPWPDPPRRGEVAASSPHQRRGDPVEIGGAGLDEALALAAEGLEVGVAGVVEVVARLAEPGLEPHVAAAGQEVPELEVDGVGHAVEDDVEDRAGPLELAPAAHVL